jgi:hypothetical protein
MGSKISKIYPHNTHNNSKNIYNNDYSICSIIAYLEKLKKMYTYEHNKEARKDILTRSNTYISLGYKALYNDTIMPVYVKSWFKNKIELCRIPH